MEELEHADIHLAKLEEETQRHRERFLEQAPRLGAARRKGGAALAARLCKRSRMRSTNSRYS